MKINWNEKYTTISIYTILTFAACLIVYTLIFNFSVVGGLLKTLFSVLAPIIWGLIIAYLLNPVMMWLEDHLKKVTDKKKPMPKLRRVLAVVITMVIFIAMLCALGAIVLPQVTDSIMGIINNFGSYIDNLEKWLGSFLKKYPEIMLHVNNQLNDLKSTLTDFINNIMPKIGDIMMKITNSTLSFILALKDFFIGLIVAIYFLFDKEHFQAQLKKIICAILPKRAAEGFLHICVQVNDSISGFISGKIVDSIIIGCLCFICMTIMKLNFAVLISVIIGITNIIPFFGPFIGAIPSAILILFAEPKQVLPFLILIFVIQQLDGNVIGPKILGQSTGLSSFWVLFSILIGSGLFGFGGMLLGVPIFAVIYSLMNEYINYLLEKKEMSTETNSYIPTHHFEPKKPANKSKEIHLFKKKDKGNKRKKK